MPDRSKRLAHDRRVDAEKHWDKMNASHGGKPQVRVHDLLSQHTKLNRTQARIMALSEEGMSDMKIGMELCFEEKTIYNYASKIRKIAGIERNVPFRLVFLQPPSPANNPLETEKKS